MKNIEWGVKKVFNQTQTKNQKALRFGPMQTLNKCLML
jgi:hypothetical protein